MKLKGNPLFMALWCVFFTYVPFVLHAQWTQTGGPQGASIAALALQNNRVWAGTWGGLYYSDDKGENWNFQPINQLYKEQFTQIIIDQDKIYALGLELTPNLNDSVRLYVSEDQGNTWILRHYFQEFSDNLSSVEFTVKDNQILFILDNSKCYRSTDDGISWTTVPAPITNIKYYVRQYDSVLAIGKEGFFYSTDGASSWKQLADTSAHFDGVIDFQGDHILVSANGQAAYNRYYSLDLGQTWAPLKRPANDVLSGPMSGFYGEKGDTIWSNYFKFWYTIDFGENWQEWDQWGPEKIVPDFLAPGLAFSMFPDVTFRRYELASKSWIEKSKGMKSRFNWSIAGNNDFLFASSGRDIHQSGDGGNNWQKTNLKLPENSNNQVLARGDTLYTLITNALLYATQNGNDNWDTLAQINFGSFNYLNKVGDAVYITVNNSPNSVMIDLQTGQITLIPNPSDDYEFHLIHSVGNRLVYIGFASLAWYSDDFGQHWTFSKQLLGYQSNFNKKLFKTGNSLFYYNSPILYKSEDGGASWEGFTNTGLPKINAHDYNQLREILLVDSVLYASITSEGIYTSKDGGATWKPFNEGLKDLWTYPLALHKGQLFVGTYHSSVWRYPLITLPTQTPTSIQENPISLFPNPASDQIQLQWQSTAAGTLEIMNAAGNIVLTQTINAGTQALHLNLPSLPSGWYSVQLRQGSRVSNKPFYLQTNN